MKKRILSALLVLCMVFSLGTVGVMADEATEPGGTSLPSSSGGRITLDKDYTLSENITIPDNVVLDLAGKTIHTDGHSITVSGNLTVTGNGKIENSANVENRNDVKQMFVVGDGATLTIENGTFETNGAQIIHITGGTANVNGGLFKCTATDVSIFNESIIFFVQGQGSKLNFVAGTIEAYDLGSENATNGLYGVYPTNGAEVVLGSENGGDQPVIKTDFSAIGLNNLESNPATTITIYSGTYVSGINRDISSKENCVMYLSGKCNVNIYGGTFKTDNANAGIFTLPYNNVDVNLNVEGGTFDATTGKAIIKTYNGDTNKDSESTPNNVSFNGGRFEYTDSLAYFHAEETTEAITLSGFVTGGTYLKNDASDESVRTYFPTGVNMDINSDGTVVPNTTASNAVIGSVGYGTLQDAISHAENGDVIYVLKDQTINITAGKPIVLDKDITIKIVDGKTVTFILDDTKANNGRDKMLQINGADVTITGGKVAFQGYMGSNTYCGDAIDLYNESSLTLDDVELKIGKVAAAFVLEGGDKTTVTLQNGADVTVTDVRGNGANGGNWVIDNSKISFTNCGDHALSVETLKATDATIDITNAEKFALYGTRIDLYGTTKVTVTGCGSDLTGSSGSEEPDYKYQTPVQLKSTAGDPKLTVGDNASIVMTGNKWSDGTTSVDKIFLPSNATLESTGIIPEIMVPSTGDGDNAHNTIVVITYTINNTVEQTITQKYGEDHIVRSVNGVSNWLLNEVSYTGGDTISNVTTDLAFTEDVEVPPTQHAINVTVPTNGTVTTEPNGSAAEGAIVTVNAKANTGYVADTITVATADGTVTATKASDASWTFIMPAKAVTITVTFKAVSTTPEDPDDKPETPVADPTLTYIYPSTGSLNQTFVSTRTEYTYTLNYWTDSVTFRAGAANGSTFVSSSSATVYPAPGETKVVQFVVRNADNDIKTYTVTVIRNSSPVAYLSDLDISAGELDPDFSRYTTSYTLTLPSTVKSVTLDPTGVSNSSVSASGYDEKDGNDYIVEVDPGKSQTVRFTVTKSGETVTYSVTVVRRAADRVTIEEAEHGEVTVSNIDAEEDDRVYIYIDPDFGYELDKLTVTDENDDAVTVTKVDDETYRFTMPEENVVVEATFKLIIRTMPFTDVGTNQWFYDEVLYAYSNGLMDGVSDTQFNPNGTMTRAMIWAVLGRIDGQTITGSTWSTTARTWAMREGVSDGTDANGNVTREQLVTMLWRFAGEPNTTASLYGWADRSSVSSYATEAMAWAVGEGIITGASATTLNPKGNATRAECAAMLMRFVENVL